MSPWPLQSQMNAFYGDPDRNNDGRADPAWEAANIVSVIPPYPLWYSGEDKEGHLIKRATRWRFLRVHRKCEDSLVRCLSAIGRAFSPEELRRYELDICAGVHVFRIMRNGRRLSIHSWGAAIDLSPHLNRLGRAYSEAAGMMPMKAVDIFAAEGWTWLGRAKDAMHFQAARVR